MVKELPIRTYSAAGGVVVDASGQKILVLVRPDRQGPKGGPEIRLPKGHVEPDEGRHQSAVREIREETGLRRVQLVGGLGHQKVEFNWKGRHYIRDEYYFLMEAPPGAEPHDPEEQFEPQWTGWDDALAQLTFEAEREWVRRARAAWERTRGSTTLQAPPEEDDKQPETNDALPAAIKEQIEEAEEIATEPSPDPDQESDPDL